MNIESGIGDKVFELRSRITYIPGFKYTKRIHGNVAIFTGILFLIFTNN